MNRSTWLAYVLLTAIAFAAIGLFAIHWLRLGRGTGAVGAYVVASLLIAYQVMVWVLRWLALVRMRRHPSPPPVPASRVAVVTTFVPGAESLEMLEQTVAALVGLDGAHDTWVLDEGDDPTVSALCIRYGAHHFSRARHPDLRTDGAPYAIRTKHGNYNAWLHMIGYDRYDMLVAFDPDHVPERHYLRRTLGYFVDPEVGYVQAPQVYYNQASSWIARGAAEETYDYYSAHQMANYGLGHPIVVGSHSVHRMAALRDVGGFATHEADDLLITLRYRAHGWRGVYVSEVLAAGLTPTSWAAYMRQQTRWSRSVLDIKFRSLPDLSGQLSRRERWIGMLHGIFYLRPLCIPIAYLLLGVIVATHADTSFIAPRSMLLLLGLAGVLTMVGTFRQRFYLDPVRERGLHWRALLLQFAKWPAQVVALWQAIRGRRVDYSLTLKVIGASGRQLVLWPHLAVAALLAEAWVVAAILDPPVNATRTLLVTLVVAGSLALAWSEASDYPPAFDASWYDRYRAERNAARGGT